MQVHGMDYNRAMMLLGSVGSALTWSSDSEL